MGDDERIQGIAKQLGARIRTARRQKRITLEALSQQTDLSPGFLSRLERGESNASVSSLLLIADRLGIPLHSLFDENGGRVAPPDYVLVRAGERVLGSPLVTGVHTYRITSGDLADHRMSAFELVYPPGEIRHERFHHRGEEILYMLEGQIEFRIGPHAFLMNPGDCVHFNSERPHGGRNTGTREARMLMIVTSAKANAPTPVPVPA